MSAAAPLDAVRAALAGEEAWLVGGTVRDRLLGRGAEADLDLALAGDPRAAARRVARATGGASFALSDAHGAWRVVGGAAWQVDLVALQGATLAEDLAARDLTVNAMAEPLAGGELVDPHGGAADLAARRLRMVSAAAFDRDPLRALRVARLGHDARLRRRAARPRRRRAPTRPAWPASRPSASSPSCARSSAADAAVAGLRLLDDLGLTAVVLPELDALHGVEQSVYHHLDVHGHTLEVLQAVIDLERDPGAVLVPRATPAATPRARAAARAAGRRPGPRRRPAVGRAPARRGQAADARGAARRARRLPGPRPRRRRAGARGAGAACGPASGCARTSRR